MAQSTLTRGTCYWGTGSSATWNTTTTRYYSGVSGGVNYRSKFTFTTGNLAIAHSNYLLVKLTIDTQSSIAGAYGVLSTRGDLAANVIASDTNRYGSYANGPNEVYFGSGKSGYLAESDTYTTSACTTLYSGYNQQSGTSFYLKFNTSAIKANTTYYMYLMLYIKSGDTTSTGYTAGQISSAVATLNYTASTFTTTLDALGGTVTATSITRGYPNGAGTLLSPTKDGYKFRGWYADIGANGPINLGRAYMYTNKFHIHFDAYMQVWQQFSNMNLMSCTQNGGFNINDAVNRWSDDGGQICFNIWDAGANNYVYATSDIKWKDLYPGWHSFDMIFDGTYVYGYVDGTKVATSSALTGGTSYNAYNVLWVGAEAAGNTTDIDTTERVFTGKISNLFIANTANINESINLSTFAVATQNITLYPRWHACEYVYIKIDGEWRIGALSPKIKSHNWHRILHPIPDPPIVYEH